MKSFKFGLALALSCVASGAARAEIFRRRRPRRCAHDISGIFQDTNGMSSVEAARMAAEDLPAGQEHQGRDRLRRSPEQGRRRFRHRAKVARGRRASMPSSMYRIRRSG